MISAGIILICFGVFGLITLLVVVGGASLLIIVPFVFIGFVFGLLARYLKDKYF